MSNIEQSISLFSMAFYVCLAIMVIGFALALFFFFHYKIPVVYALMTGKVQKKTIEQMKQSGVLRHEEDIEKERAYSTGLSSDQLSTDDYSTQNIAKATVLKAGETTEMIKEEELLATTLLEPEPETTLLEPEPETTVLHDEVDTTIFNAPGETVDFGVDEQGSTLYVTEQNQRSADGAQNTGQETGMTEKIKYEAMPHGRVGPGHTEKLSPSTEKPQGLEFEVIEHTLVVHTEEEI